MTEVNPLPKTAEHDDRFVLDIGNCFMNIDFL